MNAPQFASVVVPSYNRKEILESTLHALLDQTVPVTAYEIIVVDDGSTDDTAAYLDDFVPRRQNLRHIRHPENRGLVVARNHGIQEARGDIVIFLDNDNVPEREFIEAHLWYHGQNADGHVAVMGNARYASECIEGSNFARYLQSRYLACRPAKNLKDIDFSNLPAHLLGGLNFSVQRTDLLAVGMFDLNFGAYYGGDDSELGYRLHKAGLRIIFGEKARSTHYEPISMARYKNKIIESAREGFWVIFAKSPDYFEQTQIRFLLPVDWKTESLGRIMTKLVVRWVLNPASVIFLERLMTITDRCSRFYFGPLYRAVIAGWHLQGQKYERGGKRLVNYGDQQDNGYTGQCFGYNKRQTIQTRGGNWR